MWGIIVFFVIVLIWYFFVYGPGLAVVKVCYFYRPGCPACAATEPYWNRFAVAMKQQKPNISVEKINVATPEGQAHAQDYGVQFVPTITKTRKNMSYSTYQGGKISYTKPGDKEISPGGLLVEGWDVESLMKWV